MRHAGCDVLMIGAALIVAAAVVWAGLQIAAAIRASGADQQRDRALRLLAVFAPGVSAAELDPRALLVWEPLARTARQVSAEEFALLDRASGARFPFSRDRLQAAHARWTAEWLAWERHHDAEYKLKATVASQQVAALSGLAGRAHLDAIEFEKLELYQRRYEEYVRIARGLQALIES